MSETKNKGGRPPKYPGEGRRPTLSLRVRGGLYDKLKQASELSERTISEEMERRLEASFTAADLRTIIREEVRAAFEELIRSDCEAIGAAMGCETAYRGIGFNRLRDA